MKTAIATIEYILKNSGPTAILAMHELRGSEAGKAILAAVGREAAIRLNLQREGVDVKTALLQPGKQGVRFEFIEPGKYTLTMQTGRVLWERVLTARDVISRMSLGGSALPAAAQTESYHTRPTVTEITADGAFGLRVYAGREAGVLQCVLNSKT